MGNIKEFRYVTLDHEITVPFDFDTADLSPYNVREIRRRYYDYIYWCENNAEGIFEVEKQYKPQGITIKFELEQDYVHFMDFAANAYWVFLHD